MKNQSKFIPIRDYYNEKLNFTLPRNISTMFIRDPKAVLFILARHKFVAKVLKDKKKILDVGCGEGFGTSFIAGINQHQKFLGVDRIQDNIDDANLRISSFYKNINFKVADIFKMPKLSKFDGIYSLDMLEHINKNKENQYLKNIKNLMTKDGVFIVGMPSLESQVYASIQNRQQHINCKNLYQLQNLCKKHFNVCLPFSMNDEVIHTGYDKMSQYIFIVCAN